MSDDVFIECPECEICCAIGVCCPPEKQMDALVKIVSEESGCDPDETRKVLVAYRKHFAVAPKSFEQVIREIAQTTKRKL